MARLLRGVAVVGALALALPACGSSEPAAGPLDLARAEQAVHALADRVYGKQAEIGEVKCPPSVPIQENLSFVCAVDIDDQPLVYRVSQRDDQGEQVQVEQAQAVISRNKLEDFVSKAARKKDDVIIGIACGSETVLVLNPGRELGCLVEFLDGTNGVATVRVSDVRGGVALISLKHSSS